MADRIAFTPEGIAADIRVQLRAMLLAQAKAFEPLDRFEPITDTRGTRYYVRFDDKPLVPFRGLSSSFETLILPDERILGHFSTTRAPCGT